MPQPRVPHCAHRITPSASRTAVEVERPRGGTCCAVQRQSVKTPRWASSPETEAHSIYSARNGKLQTTSPIRFFPLKFPAVNICHISVSCIQHSCVDDSVFGPAENRSATDRTALPVGGPGGAGPHETFQQGESFTTCRPLQQRC